MEVGHRAPAKIIWRQAHRKSLVRSAQTKLSALLQWGQAYGKRCLLLQFLIMLHSTAGRRFGIALLCLLLATFYCRGSHAYSAASS